MFTLGTVGFLQPLFLIGLAALPLIWFLLRATPPRPRTERFPGVRVLLGLEDRERTPQRTPWWLILLRTLFAAMLLFAFAEPVLNPKTRLAADGPVLIVLDGGWASASDWEQRRAEALDILAQAEENEREVAVAVLSDVGPAPERFQFGSPAEAAERIGALEPAPWRPEPTRLLAALAAEEEPLDIYWIHSGQALGGEKAADDVAALAAAMADRGALTLIGPETTAVSIAPLEPSPNGLTVRLRRAEPGPALAYVVVAYGRPPAAETAEGEALVGVGERRLTAAEIAFEDGALEAVGELTLPVALANAVDRVEISGVDHAGAVALLDDRSRRRVVAIVVGDEAQRSQPILSGAHYLSAAMSPYAALRETTLAGALGLPDIETPGAVVDDNNAQGGARLEAESGAAAVLPSFADVIVLVDVGRTDQQIEGALDEWVLGGGLLIRFAGPRLAALAAESRGFGGPQEQPLMPIALRGGGRALGGALSWTTPQSLRPFSDVSPFSGLVIPDDVSVSRQVLAEPGPSLSGRVWATLQDGTPLVTSRSHGAGRIVLFHITAAPGWSTLPLSGLFVEMMDRLVASAPALSRGVAQLAEGGRVWRPSRLLNGFGTLSAPRDGESLRIEGPALEAALSLGAAPGTAPGYYSTEDEDGAELTLAVSAIGDATLVAPRPEAPAAATQRVLAKASETLLKAPLLAIAFILIMIDAIAAMILAGALRRRAPAAALAIAALLAGGGLASEGALRGAAAQTVTEAPAAGEESGEFIDPASRRAALETVLAYVVTGDRSVDDASAAGLQGLSRVLFERTAVEPGEPAGVNLETDDLAVYSIIYWPITGTQPMLSDQAVRKLNQFLSTGGMLVVDTQDAASTFGGQEGPNAKHLRRLLGRLDIPALEKLPDDHVLTRSFYLVDNGPGRWGEASVWVAAGGGGQLAESRALGEPTPLVNDGVSPIILGSVDWAGAWAVDETGRPLFTLSGGASRETAFRFGVNIVMYAYTGNYKTDQVHIKEVLERVGGGLQR